MEEPPAACEDLHSRFTAADSETGLHECISDSAMGISDFSCGQVDVVILNQALFTQVVFVLD